MQFSTSLLAMLLATGVISQRICGISEPSPKSLADAKTFRIKEDFVRKHGVARRAAIAVKVYAHVLATSKALADGYLTQETVDEQIKVLNTAYNPYDVSFTLASTDWTVNKDWAETAEGTELVMKTALRNGTYSDLNMYLPTNLDSISPGVLGIATFPTKAAPGSEEFLLDGIRVLSSSLPGGSSAPFNLGGTATHEAGHWLGLYHTFQGGCDGEGDSVSDTPAEASPASGCPTGRDSCTATGVDPIHNYMDYTDDACYTEFSAGQIARINSAWSAYRSGSGSNSTGAY